MINLFQGNTGIKLGDISGHYKFENCQDIEINSIDNDSDIEFVNCKNVIFNEFDARNNNIKLKMTKVKGFEFKTLFVFDDVHLSEFKEKFGKSLKSFVN